MQKVKTIMVDDAHRSNLFAGYRLSETELYTMVDDGVDLVVFVDPNRGRYISAIEDWQDHFVDDPVTEHRHLRQSLMNRA